jgi:hypothetical protein
MREPLVFVHHAGQTILLDRVDEHSFSVFGGPMELPIRGAELPRPLHQIAWLNHNQLECLAPPRHIWDLPLLHPMRYSGGTLRYGFSREAIEVLQLEPSAASDSWPYVGFPELLPCFPLEATSVVTEDWDAFSRRAPNLPTEQPAELVAFVPPPQGLGFTLWGRSGDAEGVTLVFECDLSAKTVSTYNVCS